MSGDPKRPQPVLVGAFDYNWVGDEYAARAVPAWFGEKNVQSAKTWFWDPGQPADFKIRSGTDAMEAGLDLSKSLEFHGRDLPPLPGMTPGYFQGRAPSLGILGEYELLEKLGEGGMGAVFKARHQKLKRLVAIKLLPEDQLEDDLAVARFQREMRTAATLDHPNIVQTDDAGEVGGKHFLVMEYVDGLDFGNLSRRLGPLSVTDSCELIRQAAVGLQQFPERDLVHRDIKPSNLMLTADGTVKILDLESGAKQGSGEIFPSEPPK